MNKRKKITYNCIDIIDQNLTEENLKEIINMKIAKIAFKNEFNINYIQNKEKKLNTQKN